VDCMLGIRSLEREIGFRESVRESITHDERGGPMDEVSWQLHQAGDMARGHQETELADVEA